MCHCSSQRTHARARADWFGQRKPHLLGYRKGQGEGRSKDEPKVSHFCRCKRSTWIPLEKLLRFDAKEVMMKKEQKITSELEC